MSPCIGEPISYLRLERYQLRELRAADVQTIETHLAACEACRGCLGRALITPPLLVLPAMAERVASTRPQHEQITSPLERLRRWLAPLYARGALGALVAAAAAIVLWLRTTDGPGLEPPFIPGSHLGVKGGELAIELVRRHAGVLAEPTRFAIGDAFKVLITCPARERTHVDVVVYQGGQAFFPLDAALLETCGNRLNLPGAFTLDGADDAIVCAVLSAQPSDRARLEHGPTALPERSVCSRVEPAR